MVIGAASEAPAPVVEVVSGVAVVTDASVVGNAWLGADVAGGEAAPGIGVGCAAPATTDSSVVGNKGGALAVGAGEAPAIAAGVVAGAGDAVPGLNFASASC